MRRIFKMNFCWIETRWSAGFSRFNRSLSENKRLKPALQRGLSYWGFLFGLIPAQAAKPPNALFFMSDDLNTALSGFGHPQCKTPHLDKLAERG